MKRFFTTLLKAFLIVPVLPLAIGFLVYGISKLLNQATSWLNEVLVMTWIFVKDNWSALLVICVLLIISITIVLLFMLKKQDTSE